MGEYPNSKKMDPKTKAIAIIVILLIIGMVAGLVLSKVSITYVQEKRGINTNQRGFGPFAATLYTLSSIIICINISFLIGLLWIYISSFRITKSSFMFGLVVFIGALLVHSLFSLPILPATLGESLSLFGILPNFFETIALVILLYLSME